MNCARAIACFFQKSHSTYSLNSCLLFHSYVLVLLSANCQPKCCKPNIEHKIHTEILCRCRRHNGDSDVLVIITVRLTIMLHPNVFLSPHFILSLILFIILQTFEFEVWYVRWVLGSDPYPYCVNDGNCECATVHNTPARCIQTFSYIEHF